MSRRFDVRKRRKYLAACHTAAFRCRHNHSVGILATMHSQEQLPANPLGERDRVSDSYKAGCLHDGVYARARDRRPTTDVEPIVSHEGPENLGVVEKIRLSEGGHDAARVGHRRAQTDAAPDL